MTDDIRKTCTDLLQLAKAHAGNKDIADLAHTLRDNLTLLGTESDVPGFRAIVADQAERLAQAVRDAAA